MGVIECVDHLLEGGSTITAEDSWNSSLRSQWDVEKYLFETHWSNREGQRLLNVWALPDEDRAEIRRQAKRIWEIMEPLVKSRAAQGGPGIYSVTLAYRTVGWIQAENHLQAHGVARALYGWLEGTHGSVGVQLWYDSDVDRLAVLNSELGERVVMNLRDARRSLVRYQKDIELWDSVLVLISTGSV